MKSVSRFEAKLVRCTRAVVAPPNADTAAALAKTRPDLPKCLSADAVELVKEALRKGITKLLASAGWREERYLRAGQPRFGRLWQRTLPTDLGLTFTHHSMNLLCWLTTANLNARWPIFDPSATLGDALVGFLCYRLFRGTTLQPPLQKSLRTIALCRLAYPDEFTDSVSVDWHSWTHGTGGALVEAMERTLATHWIGLELGKQTIGDPQHMRSLAAGQDAALDAWFKTLERTRRWDLACFLLRVGSKLLVDEASANRWIGTLNTHGLSLANRTNLYRATLVLPRYWRRLDEWNGQARAVGYLDEDYAMAQYWKATWEIHRGDEASRKAQELLREIEPIKPGSAP